MLTDVSTQKWAFQRSITDDGSRWWLKGWVHISSSVFLPFFLPCYTPPTPPHILFFHPNSCCRHTQLQQASVSPILQRFASPGKPDQSSPMLGRIKCTCADPKHTQTHFWGQMCVFVRQTMETRKKKKSSVHPHSNSHGTCGHDSQNPEELNSKRRGSFVFQCIGAFPQHVPALRSNIYSCQSHQKTYKDNKDSDLSDAVVSQRKKKWPNTPNVAEVEPMKRPLIIKPCLNNEGTFHWLALTLSSGVVEGCSSLV